MSANTSPETIDLEAIEELKRIAQSLPIPIRPIRCKVCDTELYFFGSSTATGIGDCPRCGEKPITLAQLRGLQARVGSGMFVSGEVISDQP